MSNIPTPKTKSKAKTASKIPTSGRDSGTHSRSSSVSNLTTASDIHSEIGDAASDSAEDFKVDDRVWVNGTKPGYVKFIGKTQFAPGVWAGVLLDEPVGKNDGSVAGVKYFVCEPTRGIFARPGKLTRTATAEGSSTSLGDSSLSLNMTPKASGVIPSSRASTSSVSSVRTKYPKLKVGDRITVSSLSGLKAGTLRFIGETEFAKGEWAGIELDEPTGKNDGSVAGKRYFSCAMKYGLFSPLHKVCRPGMTTPGSMRGTSLMRSNSKDSLCSSVSTCSRASRVKLGVTSLTTSVQKLKTPGASITTTTKALQEALKEKEQHIEQLLKERDFDRAEFARLTSQREEIDAKYADLEKKQKATECEKKTLEDQFSTLQRKLEDTQFQLEEEKIAKSDFEAQFQQKNNLLKHIEEFASKLCDEKLTNIKEILCGQAIVSKVGGDAGITSSDSNEFQKKIVELETTIKKLNAEKQELSNTRNEIENLSSITNEKEKCLREKEEAIKSLEAKLKSQESEISGLSTQNADLLQNIVKFNAEIEAGQKIFNDKLSNTLKEFNDKLKEKDQIIQDTLNDLHKYKELVENKTNEITGKDSEINILKSIVNEKEAQFDELAKMVEVSQAQLTLLKEENEKNISLLMSKESSISEFKEDLEKQLSLKEQSFKEKISRCQNLIQIKDEEIKLKQSEVSNLLQEVEDKKRLMETLQKELEATKTDKEKVSDESSVIYHELNNKLADMEEKYKNLLEEKEKIAKEELQTRDAKKNLEIIRDSLLQEKSAQEEIVNDREAKLAALQAEVNRMRTEFSQHKLELQQKIVDSQMEIEAGIELKKEIDIQHGVIEEIQQQLQDSEEKCKKLEAELNVIPTITSDKNKLQTQVEELQKLNKERSEQLSKMEEKYCSLEELLENNKNLVSQREKEVSVLKEQLQKLPNDKVSHESMALSLKSLEEENSTLKNKIAMLELEKEEKKPAQLTNTAKQELSPDEEQEMESLRSQVDFLNSIIVDMEQKNEELSRQLEIQTTCWEEESDVNLNESKKVIPPRLSCDICDMFDLHDTGDCPKQESFLEEETPLLRRAGSRQIEERPYCNNCEMFGHWTLDCQEPETF